MALSSKTCPQCDFVVSDSARFCSRCGWSFARPSDQAENDYDLTQSKPSPQVELFIKRFEAQNPPQGRRHHTGEIDTQKYFELKKELEEIAKKTSDTD